MPLSAAVHDSPHCGRGQRGIDFFFKSSPILTSSVTEEKRDILAYFKRVDIVKGQEDQICKSSFTNDSDVPDCSSSEGGEIKSRKGRAGKGNCDGPSGNCKYDVNINDEAKPFKRQKNMILETIDLTDTASNCHREDGARAQDKGAKVCSSIEKVPEKAIGKEKLFSGSDAKDSPMVGDKEETVKDKNDPHGHNTPESKMGGCSKVDSNRSIKSKEESQKVCFPNDSTEVKKNAFAFMMANRARQAEAGKPSQEGKTLSHGENKDGISIAYDDSCKTLSNSAAHKCEKEGKKSTAVKKKSVVTRENAEKSDRDESTYLNSSLQDFDLTPHEKPKKKSFRKPKIKEEITSTSCTEVAVPCDPNDLNTHGDENPSNYISFSDYIKSACSMAKGSAIEESIVKANETKKAEKTWSEPQKHEFQQQQSTNSSCTITEADEVKKKVATSKPKTNEMEQEQTPNSNCTPGESDELKKQKVMSESKTQELHQQKNPDSNSIRRKADEAKEKGGAQSKFETGELQEQLITNSTCTIMKEDEIKKNGAISTLKKYEAQHQKATNSNFDFTEDDSECCDIVLRGNANAAVECDELVKRKRLIYSSEVKIKRDDQSHERKIKELPKANQVVASVQRKRARKRKSASSDSDEDLKTSKAAGVSREINSKAKEDSKSDKSSFGSSISNFFKKISEKEKDEEKNKVVFTVQADVHAPLDGNRTGGKRLSSPLHAQSCGELGETSDPRKGDDSNIQGVRKNIQKGQKGVHIKSSLDELNKIELLEQIPPSKSVKRVLKKVEKVDEVTNAEVNDTEKVKSKEVGITKKGKLPKKKTFSLRKRNVKTSGVRKKSLRRKKSESPSSDESTDELFLRKKSKPPLNDKDAVEASSNCSSISIDESVEDAEEKSSSVLQSSDASEDDKENLAHYTSQLLRQPGKLSLRLKRVHPSQESCGKQKKLEQRKANKSTDRLRVKKILKKARGSKNTQRKRRLTATQKLNASDKTKKAEADDGQEQIMHEVITLDEDKQESTKKQIPKKTAVRRKVTQTLLKPLVPKAAEEGLRKKRLVQKSLKKSDSEENDDLQRRAPRRAAAVAKSYMEVEVDENDEPKRTNKNCKVTSNKAVKIAPIFSKRPKSPPGVELLKVVPLSPSKLKARQEFLNSTVSDDVRKQVSAEKSVEDDGVAWPPFPEVSHTQQREEDAAPWNLEDPQLALKEDPIFSPLKSLTFTPDYSTLKRDSVPRNISPYHAPHLELGDIVLSLSCMKTKYPDFPVYEVFKAYYEMKKEAVESYQKEIKREETVIHLDDEEEESSGRRRKRKGKNKLTTLGRGKRRRLGNGKETVEETQQNQQEEFSSIWHEKTPHMWTQIFMPRSANQVIGNADNVTELKRWLQEWKNKPQIKFRKRKKKSTKDDDFVVSDESSVDDEECISTYLLCGPPGIGKTACVYALADELGYKVLEVNASSRRPGRQVMSQLAEATQSHSVSNTSSSASQSSNAFTALLSARSTNSVAKKDNSRKEDASTFDKDSNKTKGLSLVLFEDIDIVFDEWDDGFMSTVNSLMSTTKRPIILTATHACPILFSRIKESVEVLKFVMPPQKLTAQHLQLVALANGCHICPHDVECLVHLNNGDIRRSLLNLQFLSQSGSSHDNCGCAVPERTLDEFTMESCREIFPEAETFLQKKGKKTKLYKIGLWRKLNDESDYIAINRKSEAQYLCDKEDISWEEVESNLSFVLPFPLNEKENPPRKYPLQPDNPMLKSYGLWQYESLLCMDDVEEKEPEPVTEEPREKEKSESPSEVEKASQSCLKSLSNLYDALAQNDILSSQSMASEADIKDIGWWVKQPMAGLSDNPRVSHPKWRPCSSEDIVQEFAQRAVNVCAGEIASALEEVSAKDWPQLSLPCNRKEGTQSYIVQSAPCEWERTQKRSIINRLSSQLPTLTQVSRSAGLDYLPALRSLARQDELGAALARRRRGRRYLSHFLQLGWTVSPEDRIALANALIT